MENFIKFCVLLLRDWHKITEENIPMAVEGICRSIRGVAQLLESVRPIAAAIHRGKKPELGYWKFLVILALNLSLSLGIKNKSEAQLVVNEGVGIFIYPEKDRFEVVTSLMKRAIDAGLYNQYRLFGPELFKWASEIDSNGLWVMDGMETYRDWWFGADDYVRNGFHVVSVGTKLVLEQKGGQPMPEQVLSQRPDVERVARLLAAQVCREKDGDDKFTNFLLSGIDALPKELVESITEGNAASEKYLRWELQSIAERFCSLWQGGAAEAVTALEQLPEYSEADQSGMQRVLRVLARAAYDLVSSARFAGGKLIFKLDMLRNGVACLKVHLNGEWFVVVTDECVRLRKTVITDEDFQMATETPSIVCAYGGKFMAVIPTVEDPKSPKDNSKDFRRKECLVKLLKYLKFGKFKSTPVFDHESGGTKWMKVFILPNLALMTRADHIAAELKTGRVNRTLLMPEMDNILVVANVLSRAQRKNSGQLNSESDLMTKGLSWSKKPGGRIAKLFPRVTQTGICIPGDLMTIGSEAFAMLKNNRMPHGITSTIVGDPRLELDEVFVPECMISSLKEQSTEYVLVGKMPSFTGFELKVRGISDDGITHIHPMLALLMNADFDGDQAVVLALRTRMPDLAPSRQGGYFAKLSPMTNAKVAVPTCNLSPEYSGALAGMIYGKGLMGKFVKFWRQTLQAVVPLNPFKVSYCKEAFEQYNSSVAEILLRYGVNEFVSESGVALWDKFIADYGQGDDPFDYIANQVALVFIEMVMPKSNLGSKAESILAKMGISPEAMRTLEGQLRVMDGVANDPIGTLEVFIAIDDKLISRFLPRVIMAFLAMHTLCKTTGKSLQEHINTAPAGRKFHGKPGDWKRGMESIISIVKNHGAELISKDMASVALAEAYESLPAVEEDEDGDNDHFNPKNVFNQLALRDMLDKACESVACRASRRNGITTIPTAFAVEMFRLYIKVVNDMDLEIDKDHDDLGNEIYSLVGPGGIIYATGISTRMELKPGEELATLYYTEELCTKCGSVYGFCAHSYCPKCGKKVGHCGHTSIDQIQTTKISGQLDPRKALAWMLTRRGLDEKGMTIGADSVLAILEKDMFKGYASALSVGEVFDRYMRKFARRLAYKPGLNLSRELVKWAGDNGFNLNKVALEWPDNPVMAATLPHPADISAASAHKYGMEMADENRLCATTTSSSKPAGWMRHMAPGTNFPAYLAITNVAFRWIHEKKFNVAIKAEENSPIAAGGNTMPVAWKGIPKEVLPTVLTPLVVFMAHPGAQGDQVMLMPDYLKSVSVVAEKKFSVSKGHIVHVGEDMSFVLKDRGDCIGRSTLVSDPSNVFSPTIVEENGMTEYCVELVGKFESTPDGHVALEDGTVVLSAVLEGHTGMKLVDFNGNKGLSFKFYASGKFVASLGGKELELDGVLSPDRFCEKKMQAGASVVNAIWSMVRLVANENGTHELDEPYRVSTEIPQDKMLEQALVALHSELVQVKNMSSDLHAKLKSAFAAFSAATTTEERVTALWSLAFVPVHYVLNGVKTYVGEQMISHHAFTVQPIFSKDNCTRPVHQLDERLVKFDRFGNAVLNIHPNNSTAGAAFREDYAGMTLSLYREVMDEMYGPMQKMLGDSAKVYLFETMMSAALQTRIVAFPKLGGEVAFPSVLKWNKNIVMEDNSVADDDTDEDMDVED